MEVCPECEDALIPLPVIPSQNAIPKWDHAINHWCEYGMNGTETEIYARLQLTEYLKKPNQILHLRCTQCNTATTQHVPPPPYKVQRSYSILHNVATYDYCSCSMVQLQPKRKTLKYRFNNLNIIEVTTSPLPIQFEYICRDCVRGVCDGMTAITIMLLATKLQCRFVVSPHQYPEQRLLDVANTGRYQNRLTRWFLDDYNTDATCWFELTYLSRCVRCLEPTSEIKVNNPFCRKCYRQIERDGPPLCTFTEIHKKMVKKVKKNLAWLDEVEEDYGQGCTFCTKFLDDDSDYIQWKKIQRSCCTACFRKRSK
jgi:hypothetical protein